MIKSLIKKLLDSNKLTKKASSKLLTFIRKYWSVDVSEAKEASYLIKLLKKYPEAPKYLVDVGAHNGISLSNSYQLIQSGWSAVLMEPNPSVFPDLKARYKDNEKVICVNKACSNTTGFQPFYFGFGSYTGTLCTDDNEWFKMHRTDKSIPVETDTLTNVLRENNIPDNFALLLIDTEGLDYEVLMGLDFSRFKPKVIVTEEYPHDRQKHIKKYELLKAKGYRMDKAIGCNTVWIRE